ncbi:MAG: LCP family protein [Clostridia bacterium]|nr:LCP family protein [Clostridia bacterium]
MLSSVKSFVIAFAVSILIFGLIGYFIAPQIKSLTDNFLTPNDEVTHVDEYEIPPVPNAQSGIVSDPAAFPDHRSFTLLLIGSDYQPAVFSDYRVSVSNTTDMEVLSTHQRHYKADVIMLVSYNAETGIVMFSAIPSNLMVTASGITMKLGDVLERKNVTYFKDMVAGIVGMPIDYYVCCQISLFIDLINKLGGIKYDVPVNMNYRDDEERIVTEGASRDPIPLIIDGAQVYDENGDPVMIPAGKPFTINLTKGIQMLDGEKASWVLRYNSYSNGFTGKRDTVTTFFRTFFETFAREENHSKLAGVVSLLNTSNAASTNMSTSDFEELASTILAYQKYEKTNLNFPVNIAGFGDDERISFARNTVYAAYEKYRIG